MKESSNKKKGVLVGVIITLLLVVTLGVTFAIWNYSRVGDNQLLVTGDIYMKFKEDNTLTIEDALPREEYIPGKYFEFTVEGVNDYSKDIHYQILLSEGDAPNAETGRTEKIRDDLLAFKLVEVKDEEETIIFDRMSYPELNNTSVWVDTIKANTNTKTSKTYRLYMWISPLTKIGVGEDIDYDMETWNEKVYGSVKVTVQGDFNEKETFNCFTPGVVYNDQRTDEQINACIEWMTKNIGPEDEIVAEGESYKEFCGGTGTFQEATFQDYLDFGSFNFLPNAIQELSKIGIINAEINNSSISSYLEECSRDVMIPRYMNKSKITTIGFMAFVAKQLTSVNIPDSVTAIGLGAFSDNQLTSVNIPNGVITIGEDAFSDNQLKSVNISEGVQIIGSTAFRYNQLTSINIPNSVTAIGSEAFGVNDLKKVTIGSGIRFISNSAFDKASSYEGYSNENLESIVIDKTCEEIKNIEVSSEDTTKEYPWLGSRYAGTTIYGSNGEVCDAF